MKLSIFTFLIFICCVGNVYASCEYHLNNPRLINNGDGTITDNETGLMWVDDAMISEIRRNFPEAVKFKEDLKPKLSYDAWRFPTENELINLQKALDDCKCIPFKNASPNYFWSMQNTLNGSQGLRGQGMFGAPKVPPERYTGTHYNDTKYFILLVRTINK
jgi:hypothetical protein